MEYWKNLDLADIKYICEETGNLLTEEWRWIPKFTGMYMVSDLGRLKSFRRVAHKILKQNLTNKGYFYFGFSIKQKTKVHLTSVCVAMAFLGHEPCRYKAIVDHKAEGNRKDNRLVNLQVITPRRNTEKAIQHNGNAISKYTGVTWDKSSNKWRAKIGINGKEVYLGCYAEEAYAGQMYINALERHENGLEVLPYVNPTKTSKYLGVNWDKTRNKWLVRFRSKNIGRFDDEHEAHLKYQEALSDYNNKIGKL